MTLHVGGPVPNVRRIDADPVWLALQLAQAEWRSASTGGSNCAEVALLPREITAVRDSVNPDLPPLVVSDAGFGQFTDAVTTNLLNRPLHLDADPVTAIGKNSLSTEWLTAQLDFSPWRFGGTESLGVAFLPRGVTALCSPRTEDGRFLIFAQSEIADFFTGIRAGLFRR
ncbi:hypothetical protein C7C46_09525 [Streptomyces tateyamensis]|uniref:DUF397 domain-containing protein n=1 Tax=Streptomyces tateyamensis TaxID=565073 RepID=A0A2V4NJU6_9ACTN|nr:DUF397 domain-containing protein [Streptomyces tateyamensis]PYC82594.1 hypothetical protein C7C46_09525 [Streptomyces tateyamensis]